MGGSTQRPDSVSGRSILQGHGIAEILITIRHPATVEAHVFGILGDLLDDIELIVAGENTDMTRMVAGAVAFLHGLVPSSW